MSTFLERIPTYRKIFHAIFNWRNTRRLLLTVAVIVTLWVVFCTEENWRGHRDWEAYKASLVAQHVPLTLEALQPPPVPDDQNFAMTPTLRLSFEEQGKAMEKQLNWGLVAGPHAQNKSLDEASLEVTLWSGPNHSSNLPAVEKALDQPDLLAAMKVYDPMLDEFTAASLRPAARFPLAEGSNGPQISLNLLSLFELREFYIVRSLEELAHGQSDRAADDLGTLFRISQHLNQSLSLTGQLISCAIAISGTAVLREGLRENRWSDAQLAMLQGELQKLDYVVAMKRGVQESFARLNEALDRFGGGQLTIKDLYATLFGSNAKPYLLAPLIPSGWLDEQRITIDRDMLNILSTIDLGRHEIDTKALDRLDREMWSRGHSPREVLVDVWARNIPKIIEGGADDAARLDETQVACALERYRQAKGDFPSKLDDLVPQFMPKLPPDATDGKPFLYRHRVGESYLVISSVENYNATHYP